VTAKKGNNLLLSLVHTGNKISQGDKMSPGRCGRDTVSQSCPRRYTGDKLSPGDILSSAWPSHVEIVRPEFLKLKWKFVRILIWVH